MNDQRPQRRPSGSILRLLAVTLRTLGITVLGLVVLVPLLWVASPSLMRKTEFVAIPTHWLPEQPDLTAYRRLLVEQHFRRYYLNSIIVAATVSLSSVFFSTLTGYAVSTKYSFVGKNAFFAFILGTILRPSS